MLIGKGHVCAAGVVFSKECAGICTILGNIAVGIPLKRRYNKVNVAFGDKRRLCKCVSNRNENGGFNNAKDSNRRTEV